MAIFRCSSRLTGTSSPHHVSEPQLTSCRTIDDVRRQIPAHLFVRSTFKSLMYLFGDMVMCLAVFAFAYHIDGWTSSLAKMPELGGAAPTVAKAANIAMWCS